MERRGKDNPSDKLKIEIRTLCPECGYRHQKGRTAGFFVPLGFNGGRYDHDAYDAKREEESPTDDAVDSETELPPAASEGKGFLYRNAEDGQKDAEEEDAEANLHRPMTAEERSIDARLRVELGSPARRLNTPKFVHDISYVRCNCITGVPGDVLGWLPVPHPRFIGGIRLDPKDLPDVPQWPAGGSPPSAEVLGLTLPFLDGRSVGLSCCVSPEWHAVGRKIPRYLDLLHMDRVASFRAHDDAVEALVAHGTLLFTAGDKLVKLWRSTQGRSECDEKRSDGPPKEERYKHVSSPIRDSAVITALLPSYGKDGSGALYTASSNGYIRQWTLRPSPSEPSLANSASEHLRQVNTMVASLPVREAYCHDHGLWNHSCRLFTGSDDRSILIWDSLTAELFDRIDVPCRGGRGWTIRSLEVSDRHLFAGTSGGIVLVYPLERRCDRSDTHLCTEEPRKYCLQTELRHGEAAVQAVKVGGSYFQTDYLFSGSRDGTIVVFRLPQAGSLDFQRVALLCGHKLGITCMATTWSHLYTGAEDGLRMWELSTIAHPFCFQRSLDTSHPGGVKCLCIEEGRHSGLADCYLAENDCQGESDASMVLSYCSLRSLYVGLDSGEVQKWNLGEWV